MFKFLSLMWALKILFLLCFYISISWQPQIQHLSYSHGHQSHIEAQVKWTWCFCHHSSFCVHKLKYHNLIPSHLNPVLLNLSITVNLKVTSINPSLTVSQLRHPTLLVCLQNCVKYITVFILIWTWLIQAHNFIFQDSLGCQLLWSFVRGLTLMHLCLSSTKSELTTALQTSGYLVDSNLEMFSRKPVKLHGIHVFDRPEEKFQACQMGYIILTWFFMQYCSVPMLLTFVMSTQDPSDTDQLQ